MLTFPCSKSSGFDFTMVLIEDGNSEIGANVWINLCYLICLRQLIKSRAVTNRIFCLRKESFSFTCAQQVTVWYKYHGFDCLKEIWGSARLQSGNLTKNCQNLRFLRQNSSLRGPYNTLFLHVKLYKYL